MSNVNLIESTCHYLFGQEPEQIFTNIRIANLQEKRAVVNQCLELAMRINVFLLTQKDAFFLIDPMAFNNQCHLYALMAAQIRAGYSQKSPEEKQERSEENRFIHLSIFLNYALLSKSRKKLFVRTVHRAIKEMQAVLPTTRKKFFAILKHDGRERVTRLALNRVFENHIKQTLIALKQESPVYRELGEMAFEDLRLESSRGRSEGILYAFPKLAGVVYMIDIMAKEKLAYVIKVKVLTKDGAAGTLLYKSGNINENKNAPILIFEGIATDGTYSVPTCCEKAKRCPTFFYRKKSAKKRHNPNESCFYCKPAVADLEPFRKRLESATASPRDMFFALGADFILQIQKQFRPYFENTEKYPLLSQIFHESTPKIKELGLEMLNPRTFSVCHVHMDTALHALSPTLLLDTDPEKLLQERGLI